MRREKLSIPVCFLAGLFWLYGCAAATTPSPASLLSPTPSSIPAATPSATAAITPVPLTPAPADSSPLRFADRDDIWFVSDFSEGMDDGIPQGWKLDDKKEPIEITLVTEGGQWSVCFQGDDSAFGIYKKESFKIKDYPYLNWEWKVLELPEGGDFRSSDTDDQAAQIYVSFGSLSFLNKAFVRAVGYYWSSTVPVGTEGECPTWGKSRVVILQSGPEKSGKWIREKRNVYEDYVRLFQDKDPSKVSAVRLYTNSQHTKSKSLAYFRNVYFSRD